MRWSLGWNWDKVREWIKVGALVVIAFSMLQIGGLLREIRREISSIEGSLSAMYIEMSSMEGDLDSIFRVLNRME